MIESGYRDEVLTTNNTKLAAVLLVFGAKLRRHLPLEWVDLHETREGFLKHLEGANGSKPKQWVTWNIENTIPARQIIEAYEKDLGNLYAELEAAIEAGQKDAIKDACSRVIARACRDALDKRQYLVDILKSVPQNAKYDEVHNGSKTPFVKIGKNASAELRAALLSKL